MFSCKICLLTVPQIGLKGCGINVAYGLAKYDLRESLLKAEKWHHDDPAALAKFLVDWRAELRQLLHTDPDGHIGRRCSTLANRVSEDFPDVPVIFAYTHPLTSWSHGRSGTNVIPDISTQQLDLRRLATFCSHHFGWCPQKVHHKFESVIWQGVCVRVLAQVTLNIIFCVESG
jgi:holliday junction resolvase YEN1